MRLEAIKTPCRCRDEKCAGHRITQLHLYARNDDDVELLERFLNALAQNVKEPIRSTDITVEPEAILPVLERVKIAAGKHN